MKPTKKEYASREEKRNDFWMGIGIGTGLNTLMALLLLMLKPIQNAKGSLDETLNALIDPLTICFPFVANLGVMLYFARTRYAVVLGMLSVFGVVMFFTVLASVIFMIYCFIEILPKL